jgi:citrate lyase beta subunit
MTLLTSAADEFRLLTAANRADSARYPGERPTRQPVHTVYGGAHLYRADTTERLGVLAMRAFANYARDPRELMTGVGLVQPGAPLDDEFATKLHARVRDKLASEAVEDFRIDFEDGFGARPEAEEDAVAVRAAGEVARAASEGRLSPFIGIRIKSLGEEWTLRAARTVELFLDELLSKTGGVLPPNFVVTLPKVTVPEQPRLLVRLFELLEERHGLPAGTLKLELMIETTQSLFDHEGRLALAGLLAAAQGRCTGAHLGVYDFTAACNVTAAEQRVMHPLCDVARALMTFALAGTGVFLSDGATNVMPVGLHRGDALGATELAENRASVHAAWQLSFRAIRHALASGIYQGWDLHPAQLPVRYAASYAFFLEGFSAAAERLRNFVATSAQATLVGDVFDDAATGQGLLNYFLRALNSGAIGLGDLAQTGLLPAEVELRSFAKILAARRARLGH